MVITSLRQPDDIDEALIHYAKEQGLSMNRGVKRALRAFIGVRKDGLTVNGARGKDIAAAKKIVEAFVE